MKILELLESNRKIKQGEIAKKLDVSMASVQRAMKRMIEQGFNIIRSFEMSEL